MSIWIKCAAGALIVASLVGCGKQADDAAASSTSMPTATPLAANAGEVAQGAKDVPVSQRMDASGWSASPSSPSGGAPSPKPQLASYVAQRSVIRKATISLRVTDIEKSEKTVDHETEAIGGYVDATSSTDLNSDHPQMDVTVRVPVAQFDGALEKFEALGVSLSKTVSSDDVTGQLVDLDARMRTLGAEEDTYRNLLRRVTKMADIIALQDKLTDVRSQLESMGSQRKTLGSLAALSTITVHLERSAQAVGAPVDPTWVGQTWGESTTQLGGFFRTLVVGGVWFIVFCPLWIPLAFLVRWGIRSVLRQTKPVTRVPEQPVG
jgi:uncharacterized protein DUF4349